MEARERITSRNGLLPTDPPAMIKALNGQRDQVASGNITNPNLLNSPGSVSVPPATNMEKVRWVPDFAALSAQLLATNPHSIPKGFADALVPTYGQLRGFISDIYQGATQPPDPWTEDWTTDFLGNFPPQAQWQAFTPAFVTNYTGTPGVGIADSVAMLVCHNFNKMGCASREWFDNSTNTWFNTVNCIVNSVLPTGASIWDIGPPASKCKKVSTTYPHLCDSV